MSLPVPSQIRNGLSRCRTQLQSNQEQIAACVADMARAPDVDLTEELERLTAEGDVLRRKLAMFENAASMAVENLQTAHLDVQSARLTERCEAAVEFSVRRTKLAEQLDQFIEGFKLLKRDYDQADEHTRVALWQAASDGLTYQEANRRHIDGSCGSPLLEELSQVLLRYHHDPSLAAASVAREAYVKSVVADLK